MKPDKTGDEEEKESPRKGLLGGGPSGAEEAHRASQEGGDDSVATQDCQELGHRVDEANVGASGKEDGAFQGAN